MVITLRLVNVDLFRLAFLLLDEVFFRTRLVIGCHPRTGQSLLRGSHYQCASAQRPTPGIVPQQAEVMGEFGFRDADGLAGGIGADMGSVGGCTGKPTGQGRTSTVAVAMSMRIG